MDEDGMTKGLAAIHFPILVQHALIVAALDIFIERSINHE
jgi:hypothetical protein